MTEKKPKIEYEANIVQNTVRVKAKFDTGETVQFNYPVGIDERIMEEDLKNYYEDLQKTKLKPVTVGKKQVDW